MARLFFSQKAPSKMAMPTAEPKAEQNLQVVVEKENVAVVSGGEGMVVLPKERSLQQVLGYSHKACSHNAMPEGFAWWLNAINESIVSDDGSGYSIPSRLRSEVAPMLTSQWGQEAPFNQLCPQMRGEQCVTGCVATAIAQLCRYHHYPEHGYSRNIYTWYSEVGEQIIDKDFSTIQFDYGNMLDSYLSGYTEQQSAAVASLMEVCGKAAEMQYGIGASSTNCGKMQSAMALYLNYPFIMYLERDRIADDVWLGRVYSNISRGQPVYYSGGGHGFIFDGYDADGNVHVNWGWDGNFDGYFNINALNPDGSNFNRGEEMCCDIRPVGYKPQIYEVTVPSAGSLAEVIDDDEVLFSDRLKVNGNINGTDFNCLRNLVLTGRLIDLDLTDANVVAGGQQLGPYDVSTEDNVFPDGAFGGCYHLGAIKLPKTVTTIGGSAFFLNEYLLDFTVPASVTDVSGGSFGYMPQLCRLKVDEGNPVFDSRNDCNAIIRTATNELVRGCQGTKIPEDVTSIGEFAFYSCYWLKYIDLPASLKHIGDFAFSTCTRLREINIPEGVETIGAQAFWWCGENIIKEIKLPTTLRSIGYEAFSTNSIEKFVLPASVTSIGFNLLSNCGRLKSVRVEEGNTVYDSRDNCNAIILTANDEVVSGSPTAFIPNTVKRIGERSFTATHNLTHITIPEGADSIKDMAFSSCTELESVSLPYSLKYIDEHAFSFCGRLTSITIPPNVEYIGLYAFADCTELKEIIVFHEEPLKYHSIFNGCSYDIPLYVPIGSKAKYEAAEGWRDFTNIIEADLLDPDGIKAVSDNAKNNVPIYDLNGRQLTFPQKGINIVGGKKVYIP